MEKARDAESQVSIRRHMDDDSDEFSDDDGEEKRGVPHSEFTV